MKVKSKTVKTQVKATLQDGEWTAAETGMEPIFGLFANREDVLCVGIVSVPVSTMIFYRTCVTFRNGQSVPTGEAWTDVKLCYEEIERELKRLGMMKLEGGTE